MSTRWGRPRGARTGQGNGARTFMGVLLDGRKITPQGNNNYGDYNNEKTNQLIDQALAAADQDAASAAWAAADKQAMTDAAWVAHL